MDALSNFVIAALTAALIFVGAMQWNTSTTQSKILRDNLATTKIIERAYLAVDSIGLENFGPDKSPLLNVKVRNTGHLPATLVEVTSTVQTEEPFEQTPVHSNWNSTAGVVAPNASFTSRSPLTGNPIFSPEEWNRIVTGKYSINIYGAIRYRDGFGEIRETGYGFYFDPTLDNKPIGLRFALSRVPSFSYMK